MGNYRGLVGVVALALLSGCATMTEDECRFADWYEIGLRDGREARPQSRIGSYLDACAPFQVRPDMDAWEQGRAVGLGEFCQLPVALERGLNGYSYDRVCGDPEFERVYLVAKALYDARDVIRTTDADIERKENKLLKDKELTEEERAELELEVRNLERKRDRAKDDRDDAERRLDRVRTELGL
jgi:hypothetical protein